MRRSRSATICAIIVLAISLAANRARAQAPQAITVQSDLAQAAENNIRTILVKPFSGKFANEPLTDFVASLQLSTKLPIYLDRKSLEDASIDVEAPVRCDVANLPLHTALSQILDRLELVWTIHEQYVWITTPDKAGSLLIVRIYPVQDLVTISDERNRPATAYLPLASTIINAVAPYTWDEVGGPGWITPFAPSGSLVITQTFAAHEEIALFLTKLRASRDVQQIISAAPPRRRHVSRLRRQTEPDPAESAAPPHYHFVPPPTAGMGGGMF